MSEKRDRRRSVLPLVSAREIREGWIGQEGPSGLSDGRRDRVRGGEARELKLQGKG